MVGRQVMGWVLNEIHQIIPLFERRIDLVIGLFK
jgi:hypothetical protein